MKRLRASLYLSKEESDRLKGLLILLIVLGHHHVLTPIESFLHYYLYTFHVICFFILPFFYANSLRAKKWNYIVELFCRNMIPYTIFFVINIALFHFSQHSCSSFSDTVCAWIIGSPYLLKTCSGFIFLWFLPAYMSFSIARFIMTKYSHLALWLTSFSFILALIPWEMSEWLRNHLPFGLFSGVVYLWLGGAISYTLRHNPKFIYAGPFLFVTLSILYYYHIFPEITTLLLPIGAFLTLALVTKLIVWKWIGALGRHSLPIYLVHMYFLTAFQRTLPNVAIIGVVTYLLTILISYSFSVGISKTRLNFIFHPNIRFDK